MFLSKVKFAVIVLLAFGLIGSGAGLIAHRPAAGQPASKAEAAPPQPAGVAAKTKKKDTASEPYQPPPAVSAESQRLRDWRDKLNQHVNFAGIDDPKCTLDEALQKLGEIYKLSFTLNEKAFRFEQIMDVGKTEVASPKPTPAMKTKFGTVLRTILARVPVPSGATYLFRQDHVEITTNEFVEIELGRSNDPETRQFRVRPEQSLMWDAFEDTPVAQVLQRIADANGLNVVTDPRVAKQLQIKVTAQFNNVAVDTALRLLLNMADVSMVQVDNVFYLTTAENAKRLREEQARIKGEEMLGGAAVKPAPDKPAK